MKHCLTLMLLCGALGQAYPQGTAFTYQGRLDEGGQPASGIYDLRFAIYDLPAGGAVLGGPVTNSPTTVSNGLFTVTLDFGAGVFTGAERWLEIGVRTYEGGAFTALSPRQSFTATPYAIRAANFSGPVDADQLAGIISPGHIGAGSIDSTKLAAGAVTADKLAAGAVTTAALADGAVTAAKVFTVSNWLTLTITNPAPEQADVFGGSAAALGNDRLIIGAPNAAKAYLLNLNGELLNTFTNPGAFASSSTFGSSLAALGNDRVWIGARTHLTGGAGAGAAFLFTTSGALLTTINNPTPANNDEFGSALTAVGSSSVLIGAYADDTSATNAGIAYLFSTNGLLLTTFTNPAPIVNNHFGFAVAALGSGRVLIGAPNGDTGASNAGTVYLFSTNGALLTTFTNPTPAIDDQFGVLVAALGTDRVLVGTPQDDTGIAGAGAAYLFDTNGTLLASFFNPTPGANDQFGISVAALGSDRVIVGSISGDGGGFNVGSAHLFHTNGALLFTFNNPTPVGNDQFGSLVTAVGDRVLVSAFGDDTGALNTGAAYLFSMETFTPGLVAAGVRAGAVTTTTIAAGAVSSVHLAQGAVGASKLADGAVTTSALADDAVTIAKLDSAIGVWTRAGDSVFRPAGNVGIGTANPQTKLHIVTPDEGIRIQGQSSGVANSAWMGFANGAGTAIGYVGDGSSQDNSIYVGSYLANVHLYTPFGAVVTATASSRAGIARTPTGNTLEVEGSASKTVAGSWVANSDARIKTDVRTVTHALDKLEQVRPVEFRYTAEYRAQHPSIEDRPYLNVIAQEFQQVFPEAVKRSGDKLPNGDDILQVDTYPLTIYSAAAIRELNQKLEEIRSELQRRDAENAGLKRSVEELKTLVNALAWKLDGGER